jgi:outer membrane protein OmpA-like peptidoglycan-associated protein
VAHKGVASGDELERKDVAWSSREHPNGGEKRLTMKGYTPIDWSTKPPTENVTSEIWSGTGSVPVARGAVAIVGETSKPPPFAARRASEALDRLAGSVTIRHEKRGAVITLANDELVDSGQWVLTTSGQYTVRGLAAGLREQYGRTIFIQVYTDSMGSAAVNDALSLRRAEAIRDYLSTQGVAAESMRAEGQGSKRPLASNGTADGRAQNRRIEIVIAPQEREVDGH